MSEEASDKKHDASEQKIRKAREKGQVPKSTDVLHLASYCGLCAALALAGQGLVYDAGGALQLLWTVDAKSSDAIADIFGRTFSAVLPIFVFPASCTLLALASQRSFVISSEKLRPKIQRVSIIENAKQKFGAKGAVEFLKTSLKLFLLIAIFSTFLWWSRFEVAESFNLPVAQGLMLMMKLVLYLLCAVVLLTFPVAILDFVWQRHSFAQEQRMSDKEMRDEFKENEGDPNFKQARRQRGREIAMNRMLSDVPNADVVIVNPTHVAVALMWDRQTGTAPVCVAKGHDEVALKIRSIALEAGVPLHKDPPAARAIDAGVSLGAEIPVELYSAVATAIRYADEMRQRASRR
ncbi:MAG: flagellar type III secretion system protein FlhB [Pseudomonadota bacterium]|nr:flagellar type III secretion system protein FlhB [Pseudomonadota bacterium]